MDQDTEERFDSNRKGRDKEYHDFFLRLHVFFENYIWAQEDL